MAVAAWRAREVVEAVRPPLVTPRGSTPAATRPWTAQAVDCELVTPPAERPAAVGALGAAQVARRRRRSRAAAAGERRAPAAPRRCCRASLGALGAEPQPPSLFWAERSQRPSAPSSPARRAGGLQREDAKAVRLTWPVEGAVAAALVAQLGDEVAAGEDARVEPGAVEREDRPLEVAGESISAACARR